MTFYPVGYPDDSLAVDNLLGAARQVVPPFDVLEEIGCYSP